MPFFVYRNPKLGFGSSRTAVWGLQRPPIGTMTWIRCDANAGWDAVAPIFVLFHATNARDQIQLSIDPSNEALISLCEKYRVAYVAEAEDAFDGKANTPGVFNVLHGSADKQLSFPMAGHFVSLYFPLGHIKSTKPKDDEFTLKLEQLSKKWLTTLF